MSSFVVLAALGPLLAPLPAVQDGPLVALTAETPGRTWREAYRWVMTASSKRGGKSAREVVPNLVALYKTLPRAERLPAAERSRMRRILANRLEKQRDKLLRARLRSRRAAETSGAGGGAAPAAAQQLIDLIQTTIEPESWQVNGGRGTISYFGLWHVLVVRQTAEVHGQIGNVLRP